MTGSGVTSTVDHDASLQNQHFEEVGVFTYDIVHDPKVYFEKRGRRFLYVRQNVQTVVYWCRLLNTNVPTFYKIAMICSKFQEVAELS